MGLLQAMGKITSFTNQIVNTISGTGSSFGFGTNIPTNSALSVLGITEDLSFNSIGDIKNSINSIIGGVSRGVTMVKCAYDMFSLDNGLDFLLKLASAMDNAIQTVIDQIFDAVATQVAIACQQIIGTVINFINAIANLINSVLAIADAIKKLWNSWTNWGEWKWEFNLENDSCSDMFAAIAGCLLNKFLGPYLDEFTNKIVGKINEVGNNINDKLYDEFQDVNMFSSYANQEAFLLKKASIQLQGFSKESILGVS